MIGVSGARRRRRDCVIERVETVPMTAVQYERAVNALATLIVEWMTSPRRTGDLASGHSEVE